MVASAESVKRELAAYYTRLEGHDWFWQHSESQAVHEAGRQAERALRSEASYDHEKALLFGQYESYIAAVMRDDPIQVKPRRPKP